MNALIIGGTRGIGKATAELLRAHGWDVTATGRAVYDVHRSWGMPVICDAFIYCAGSVTDTWKDAFDFPQMFYALCLEEIVKDNGVIVAVSSVAAERPAKVNPHYAAAKAALESYARTVGDSEMAREHGWRVEVVRFDLVDTDKLKQLPPETLAGRTAITAEEAAGEVVRRITQEDKRKG